MHCTGERCPMQFGFDVKRCTVKGCPHRTEPKTNADRIRAMTDEELAEWALYEAPNIGREYSHSLLGLIQWLKQPAEVSE